MIGKLVKLLQKKILFRIKIKLWRCLEHQTHHLLKYNRHIAHNIDYYYLELKTKKSNDTQMKLYNQNQIAQTKDNGTDHRF